MSRISTKLYLTTHYRASFYKYGEQQQIVLSKSPVIFFQHNGTFSQMAMYYKNKKRWAKPTEQTDTQYDENWKMSKMNI